MPKNVQSNTQLHSSHTLVKLKILQARLQQYVNRELPDVQAAFRKDRGTRDQIANIRWIIEKAREFQKKKSISVFLTMPKPLTVWITINVENSERDGNTRPSDLPPEKSLWKRLLRASWTARRSNQSILKEITPEYSLEGLMLKLTLQCFDHLMQRASCSEKTLILGKIKGRRRRGRQEETVGWITDAMDMSLRKLREIVKDREA